MWQTITTVAGGILALILAWVRLGGKASRLRSRIGRDLELLQKLPDHSTAKSALLQHIDSTVDQLVTFEKTNDARRTDWSGIGAAGLIAAVAALFGVFLHRTHLSIYVEIIGWAFFGFLVLFAIVGVSLSVRKSPENEPDKAPEKAA